MSPMAAKLITLGMLSTLWLGMLQSAKRLDGNQPFHVASDQRDRRKARFYYLSVWAGLAAAFLSFLCLDALASAEFDNAMQRNLILGILRSVGVFGLLVIGVVWTQIGQRASQPILDGQALTPLSQNPAPPVSRNHKR